MSKSKASVLKSLMKKLPDGSVYTLDDEKEYGAVQTGISTLDYATGIGGFPRNKMTLVYGTASTGKTAMVLQTIGNYQKNNPDSMAAVIDLEDSMTVDWAKKFGINPENLLIVKPTDVEEMITMTMECVKAKVFDIIVVDSLGAGLLRSELDNDKSRMAGSAGAVTRMVKAINSAFIELKREERIAESNGDDTSDFVFPAVVLINQARQDMNSMYGGITYSGGKALTHMMSIIIQLKRINSTAEKIEGTVDGVKMRVGWLCSATIEKNKLATPGKSAGYAFIFKECPEYEFGIDNARSVSDLSIVTGIARVEGKTIYYPTPDGEAKVVGRNNYVKALKDESLCQYIAEMISKDMSSNIEDPDLEIVKEINS